MVCQQNGGLCPNTNCFGLAVVIIQLSFCSVPGLVHLHKDVQETLVLVHSYLQLQRKASKLNL